MLKDRINTVKAAVVSSLMVFSGMASAELPTWASTLGADFTGHVTDASAMVGPVIAASLGAVIVIKLIKRFANKI